MSNISPEYQEMIEAIKADKEKADSGGTRKYWAPPSKEEGTFTVRFLPPLKKLGEKKFYFDHKNHWIDGKSFECLNQTIVDKDDKLHEAETCPICSMSRKFYKIADNNRNSDEFKLAGELTAKQRYIYKIIVRNADDETTPKFYETGPTIFKSLYHILTETDYGIIVDPKNGRDYNIVKVGTGRTTRYDQSLPAAKETPIFTEAVKVKECISKALVMKYNSLIEFLSKGVLESALREYLDPDAAETQSVVPSATVNNSTLKGKVPASVLEKTVADNAVDAVADTEEEEGDAELNDILSEFEDM